MTTVPGRDRVPDQHHAVPALVCIENTHNRCGGVILSMEYLTALQDWASSQVPRATELVSTYFSPNAACLSAPQPSWCRLIFHQMQHA